MDTNITLHVIITFTQTYGNNREMASLQKLTNVMGIFQWFRKLPIFRKRIYRYIRKLITIASNHLF